MNRSSRTNAARLTALLTAAIAVIVVAFPAAARADDCPNAGFREGASAPLPDCRAYELVSPLDKNGGDVMQVSSRTRAARDGEAVSFASLVAFAGIAGTGISTDYIARRGPAGWATHGITPRQESQNLVLAISGPGDRLYVGEFSDDLSRGVVRAQPLPGTPPNVQTVQNLFVRTDLLTPGLGSYQLLTDSVNPIPPQSAGTAIGYRPFLAGASADFGHVIFQSNLNLLAGTTGNLQKLYEWDHGVLRLVGVLPDSTISQGAVAGQSASGITPPYTDTAISDDGSRIYFSVQRQPAVGVDGGSGDGQLYLREDAASTVLVNASEKAVPQTANCVSDSYDVPPPCPAEFGHASADGRFVFFRTAEQLTEDDTNAGFDFYRYDVEAAAGERLTLVSVDGEPGDGLSFRALGSLGVSDDGGRAYFMGQGQLVDGAPIPADSTSVLIYLWDRGELSYVGNARQGEVPDLVGTWQLRPKASRVSPDGGHLLFVTLEGDQVVPHDHGSCSLTGDGTCRELYVYSAEANGGQGELVCASCAPGGAPATADSSFNSSAGISAANRTSHQNHPLSGDGRWVFFTTPERLVAADHNAVEDVYQFEVATGELQLLSSGRVDAEGAYFLDASADGEDVFFATGEQLVAWDGDQAFDLYDARVNGGLPAPAAASPECSGDGCRGELAAAPARSGVATVGAVGGVGKPRSGAACVRLDRRASALRRQSLRVGRQARRAKGRRAARLRRKSAALRAKSRRLQRQARACRARGGAR